MIHAAKDVALELLASIAFAAFVIYLLYPRWS